jgi:hypothetical protein
VELYLYFFICLHDVDGLRTSGPGRGRTHYVFMMWTKTNLPCAFVRVMYHRLLHDDMLLSESM